jgi:hypothetical protein
MSSFFHVKDGSGRPVLVNRDRINSIMRPELSEQGLYIRFGKDDSLMIQPGPESDRVWEMFFLGLPHDEQSRVQREKDPNGGKDDQVLTAGREGDKLRGF